MPSHPQYTAFEQINGDHPFKHKVPGAFVEYRARRRRGGKVVFFNFELAREMGLIPENHPDRINTVLEKKILETFSLWIINEYDIEHETVFPEKDILPNRYMATRYLQLQHPDKTGRTSGDGRSIWNGAIRHRGTTWDISSCGTGATCLSPAAAKLKRSIKNGDPSVSYGCGSADLSDGVSAALMSEIFYKNGLKTERTLVVIEFPGALSINVRAGKNLLRPSHFFNHLKQGNHDSLKAVCDYYIERQKQNGEWMPVKNESPYLTLARKMAETFAVTAAQFESEYIFCWLDWDGDNILADGGIIDYGSVRQFGLYHTEYRYDDDERWSTTIPEQKQKARMIAQVFIQLADFLIKRKKQKITNFKNHPILKQFDTQFEATKDALLLYKIGFTRTQSQTLMRKHSKEVRTFRRHFAFFEEAQSKRAPYRTADGITRDALYCMRDALREIPSFFLSGVRTVDLDLLHEKILSSYARKSDRKLTPTKRLHLIQLQAAYNNLVNAVSKKHSLSANKLFLQLTMRASSINRYDRITGDAMINATHSILRYRKQLSFNELLPMMNSFIEYQILRPNYAHLPLDELRGKHPLLNLVQIVRQNSEGL